MLYFEDCYERVFENKNNLIGKISHFRVPANEKKGFNFEYVLMIPEKISNTTSLLLEGISLSLSSRAISGIISFGILGKAWRCT